MDADLTREYDEDRAGQPDGSAAEIDSNLDRPFSLRQRVSMFVQQSGKHFKPEQLLIWSLVAAGVAGTTAVYFRWFIMAGPLTLLSASLPWLYIWRARRTRLEKLRSQLPDAFDLMSRVLRSGQTTSQALESVAGEMPRPAAEEFGYTYEQQNLGLSPEAAMRDLARRTGLLELKVFVLAVTVQHKPAEIWPSFSTNCPPSFATAIA